MSTTLTDTDLRAVADQLGPQYAVLHCPPVTLPWYSTDDTAGLAIDPKTGDLRVVTSGPLTRDTRIELATALVATLLDNPKQGSDR